MNSKDVVNSLCDYAKKFVKEYKNPNLDPKVIEAIVVDFINFFALKHYGTNLAMHTNELKNENEMTDLWFKLEKETVRQALYFQKARYNKDGIIESVNKNKNKNDCKGKAEGENKFALEVVNEFIQSYIDAN